MSADIIVVKVAADDPKPPLSLKGVAKREAGTARVVDRPEMPRRASERTMR